MLLSIAIIVVVVLALSTVLNIADAIVAERNSTTLSQLVQAG